MMIYERGCVSGDWPSATLCYTLLYSATLCYTLPPFPPARAEEQEQGATGESWVICIVYGVQCTLYTDTLETEETMDKCVALCK